MEQITQRISQKPSLPIKTKIAAWWIIIFSGFLSLLFFWDFLRSRTPILFSLLSLMLPLVIFLLGIFVLKKSKLAWIIVTILFYLGSMLSVLIWVFLLLWASPRCWFTNCSFHTLGPVWGYGAYLLLITICIIGPLILLRLDHKNFLKIT